MKTRCKDKIGRTICVGDILHVEEYPGKYVGGSMDFDGVVSIENGRAYVTYLDIGEEESFPISMFPVAGRNLFTEKERYMYWKTMHLGAEPPEHLWKEELYRDYFGKNLPAEENPDDLYYNSVRPDSPQ